MGVLRPSMVRASIVYMQNLKAEQISEEKRACIIEALKRQLPKVPKEVRVERNNGKAVELSGRCPRCGATVKTPQCICKICGQRVCWEVEKNESDQV